MTFQMTVTPSKPAAWVVLVQQLPDQFLGVFHEIVTRVLHEVRELQLSSHDLIIDLLHVVSINLNEGVLSSQQLIENSPQRPQIRTKRVPLMNEHLRCHILRGPNKTKRFILILHHLLASPHIDQLQVPITTYHNVLWLQITIDDPLLMKSLENVDQQSYVEPGLLD